MTRNFLILSVFLNVVLLSIIVVMIITQKKCKACPGCPTCPTIPKCPPSVVKNLDLDKLKELVYKCPKTDLHLHIESGTNPALAFKLAQRNGIQLGSDMWPWKTQDDLERDLNFQDLGSFLKIFYAVSAALQKKEDYIAQAENVVDSLYKNNVVHAEIFFDPQTFTGRDPLPTTQVPTTQVPTTTPEPKVGIISSSFKDVANSLNKGLDKGRLNKNKLSLRLIVSILRDWPVGEADNSKIEDKDVDNLISRILSKKEATGWMTIRQAVAYNMYVEKTIGTKEGQDLGMHKDWKIIGVGLDSYETPYPPELFADIYEYAHINGLFKTAHCGEEGPAEFVWTGIQDYDRGLSDMEGCILPTSHLLQKGYTYTQGPTKKGLGCARIDHGVHVGDDAKLCAVLATQQSTRGVMAAYGRPHHIPITCCPMSNKRLQVFPDPTLINLAPLLDYGIMCTVNTDDPMYTGDLNPKDDPIKWVNASWELVIDNCMKNAKEFPMTFGNIKQLIINGFEASWLSEVEKQKYISQVNEYFFKNTPSLYDNLKPKVEKPSSKLGISRRRARF